MGTNFFGVIMEAPDKRTFSYVEACKEQWESSKAMRKRARARELLIQDSDSSTIIAASLENIRFNYSMLKAYTSHMAMVGLIVTNRMAFLKPPIREFYREYDLDVTQDAAKAIIHATAHVLKRMFRVLKRKWTVWELPRASRLLSICRGPVWH